MLSLDLNQRSLTLGEDDKLEPTNSQKYYTTTKSIKYISEHNKYRKLNKLKKPLKQIESRINFTDQGIILKFRKEQLEQQNSMNKTLSKISQSIKNQQSTSRINIMKKNLQNSQNINQYQISAKIPRKSFPNLLQLSKQEDLTSQ